jgi:AraC-like DNA-binding protein
LEILYQKLPQKGECLINTIEVDLPFFIVPWHYHKEIEIIFIENSCGMRYVGDHVEPFDEGDIAIIGSNLPHVWKNESKYLNNKSKHKAKACVIHFDDELFNGNFNLLPEMEGINKLIADSKFGIKFFGKSREILSEKIKSLMKKNDMEKLLKFFDILDFMSKTDEKQLLSSSGFLQIRTSKDFNRFDKVTHYIIENFNKSIDLKDIAKIANMTPNSFCRYFKKRTTKSFVTYLNEIRIGHACKLLIEDKKSISEICFESGFNNLSNFNQLFKKVKKMTPKEYNTNRKK